MKTSIYHAHAIWIKTLKMKILKKLIDSSVAQYYYEWGDEPEGYVTFFRYNTDDELVIIGVGPKEWVKYNNTPFKNPHS
jgi:hypothetical protein